MIRTPLAILALTTALVASPAHADGYREQVVKPRSKESAAVDAVWHRLALCESGERNDHGAPYFGYWQFSKQAWQSYGGKGLPDQHTRAEQLVVAKRLQNARGWKPWPACSRRLGLRK